MKSLAKLKLKRRQVKAMEDFCLQIKGSQQDPIITLVVKDNSCPRLVTNRIRSNALAYYYGGDVL